MTHMNQSLSLLSVKNESLSATNSHSYVVLDIQAVMLALAHMQLTELYVLCVCMCVCIATLLAGLYRLIARLITRLILSLLKFTLLYILHLNTSTRRITMEIVHM